MRPVSTSALSTILINQNKTKLDDEKMIGLRIGKTDSKALSDAGFNYDGQYFHYFDKWIFALTRYSMESNDDKIILKAIELVKESHPYFVEYHHNHGKKPMGVRWKINVDSSPITALGPARPSSDAVGGYIAYSLLQKRLDDVSLASLIKSSTLPYPIEFYYNINKEIDDMYTLTKEYMMNKDAYIPTTDPLGWGCSLWNLQWLQETDTTYRMKTALLNPFYRNAALNVYETIELPFRLYGALIGCNVTKDENLMKIEEKIIKKMLPVEESNTIVV
jgi:hypothetical protein